MAFADPQSVTISGVPISLPRTSQSGDETVYQSGDGLVQMLASHDYGKRNRHLLRLNHAKIAADPFRPTENRRESMSVYIVLDTPSVGYTNAEALAIYTGFNTQYVATSHALISKLLAGES